MKRTIVFLVVLCAAVSLLLTETADWRVVRADDCKASATVNTSPAKNGKYLISSNVTSRDCVKLQCRGFVHYLVSYHVGNSGGDKQVHALTDFKIDPGAQQVQTRIEYGISESGAILDGVTIESINCITTAP